MATFEAEPKDYLYKSYDTQFYFRWQVKDFDMCSRKNLGFLDSPTFRISFLKNTYWYLRISPQTFQTPFVRCSLCRSPDEVLPQGHVFGVSMTLYLSSSTLTESHPCVSLDSKASFVPFGNLRLPEDHCSLLPQSGNLEMECKVWTLPYLGRPDPKLEHLPLQPTSFTWEDIGFVMSLEGEKFVPKSQPFTSIAHSGVDVVERTVTWTIPKFAHFPVGVNSSVYLDSALGDAYNLILTIFLMDSRGTLTYEMRRDVSHVAKVVVAKCRVNVEGRSRVHNIAPSATHCFDGLRSVFIRQTNLTLERLMWDDDVRKQDGSIVLRFEIGLSRDSSERVAGAYQCLGKRPPSNATRVFKEEMLGLYRNQICCDVTLRTLDGRSFRCHKNVLAIRSATFRKRFKDRAEPMIVSDVDSDTLDKMLVFIYSAMLEFAGLKDLLKLYTAAFKYAVPSMQALCRHHLKWMVNIRNACNILVLADQYDPVFADLVKKFINTIPKGCIRQEDFTNEEDFLTLQWVRQLSPKETCEF